MYKIYINETPLLLLDTQEADRYGPATEEKMIARYSGKPKTLLNYADMLEKTSRYQAVILYTDHLDRLWADFRAHYQLIEAAGGIVYNTRSEVLFIFRRGHWDLPKGKIDPGESREAAALREVQEETGLDHVALGAHLADTYHTYRDHRKRRVLKVTYWYEMHTEEEELSPQTTEGIEKAVWLSHRDFLATNREPVFRNIVDLLRLVK